jgi:hypothetical protein
LDNNIKRCIECLETVIWTGTYWEHRSHRIKNKVYKDVEGCDFAYWRLTSLRDAEPFTGPTYFWTYEKVEKHSWIITAWYKAGTTVGDDKICWAVIE